MSPTLETVKEWEEEREEGGTQEEIQEEQGEKEETQREEEIDRFEGKQKPVLEDENFLELKEAPWLITKDLEEEIREKAVEEGESVGVVFRELLRSSLS